jgi:hypothetical protein
MYDIINFVTEKLCNYELGPIYINLAKFKKVTFKSLIRVSLLRVKTIRINLVPCKLCSE